ncbi:MAG: aminotransferase [Candidatus Cloacimonadota bacterium]|nr:MAG: aminotransferase [Candidatus Cloacimonadota bacterium]
MISDFENILSDSSKGMKKSVIRELLKLTNKPDIISFAGGLPSPDSFPVDELKEITQEVMEKEWKKALQYGSTEGDSLLKEQLIIRARNDGMDIDEKNITITTASQQGLDLLSKIMVNRGDNVIVGLPSYVGGLGAFNAYGANIIGIQLDEEGMSAEKLENVLEDLKAKGKKPKFIYVVPDFQNPAGITMSVKRRKEIIALAHKFDVMIIEDSPYRELRFEGEVQHTIYSLDNTGQVIVLGTFSKILAPGFRIGWIIADEKFIDKIVIAKQSADLCTPPFTQRIVARYCEKGYLEKRIQKTSKMYREKKDLMIECFDKYMPNGVSWTNPEGGLFLLVTVPNYIDTDNLFDKALEKKVAFVVGSAFHCDNSGHNTMRINFSYPSKEEIVQGVKRLAEAIKEYMAECKK